ncbi:hypothetical protein RQP46_002394 [Phenoliferia psychrophenolica]
MTRASFTTLPLELKARIAEMASDQEDMWRVRVIDPGQCTGHINCLSSLALVNKELRELAAKHQFKVFKASRAASPIFRYSILQRHGHHIRDIFFYQLPSEAEGAELALSYMGQLPALDSLNFIGFSAKKLFGDGPSETLALIKTFTNVKSLSVKLTDSTQTEGLLAQLPILLRLLASASPSLAEFSCDSTRGEAITPTDPALITLLASKPALRFLWLLGTDPGFPTDEDPAPRVLPSPSELSAYASLIQSRGLDPSVLDEHHLTPFHPSAKLDYTENEAGFLKNVLGRTLDFGRSELERMFAEGNVAKSIGWVAKLKAVEDERLAWKD